MEVAHADRVRISEGHPGDLGQGPGPDAGHRCQAAHDLGGIAALQARGEAGSGDDDLCPATLEPESVEGKVGETGQGR